MARRNADLPPPASGATIALANLGRSTAAPEEIAARLERLPGVRSAFVSPLAGAAFLRYEPAEVRLEAVLGVLRAMGLEASLADHPAD